MSKFTRTFEFWAITRKAQVGVSYNVEGMAWVPVFRSEEEARANYALGVEIRPEDAAASMVVRLRIVEEHEEQVEGSVPAPAAPIVKEV